MNTIDRERAYYQEQYDKWIAFHSDQMKAKIEAIKNMVFKREMVKSLEK